MNDPTPARRDSLVPWRGPFAGRPRVAAAFALGAALAVGACGTPDKPPPKPPQAVIQAPDKATVTVAERDAGARVVLATVQELRVELPNSSWAVANNLEWSVESSKPGVVTVLGSRFERAGRDDNPSEAGGATIWRIKPQAAGDTQLVFALRRPRSVAPPVQTATFEVQVR